MKNTITYTTEYYEVLAAIQELNIPTVEMDSIAIKLFKAITAAEMVGHNGVAPNGSHGVGKLVES